MIDKNLIFKYLKYLMPEDIKKRYRKHLRQLKNLSLDQADRIPLTLSEFEEIIREKLMIGEGDTIIVHSSFGNLHPDFSPEEAVSSLKRIIGPSGNILMPFYPTGHAFFWLTSHHVFNVHTGKSSTGILTQTFKESKDVLLSPHPVKSLAVWGENRDFLIEEHHKSQYPYDKYSPYYKSLMLAQSKTVGLGVETNSFLHCCEDIFLLNKDEIYSPKLFKTQMKYYSGPIKVNTYLHDPKKINNIISAATFLKITGCPDYLSVSYKGTDYFTTKNKVVFDHAEKQFLAGNSRTVLSRDRLSNSKGNLLAIS